MTVPWRLLFESTVEPRSVAVLLAWCALGLALVSGPLHERRLRARLGDRGGMRAYFAAFFGLFFAAPVLYLLFAEDDGPAALAAIGLGAGNLGLSLILAAAALPITVLLAFVVSRDPALGEQYPYSKQACESDRAFAAYEAGYLLLYYPAWELLFRGLLFFPLMHALGFPAAAAITTAISTVLHIGHPDTEVLGAVVGGLIFALMAGLTGSIIAPFAAHAAMGVADDAFIYARWHRGKAAAPRTGPAGP